MAQSRTPRTPVTMRDVAHRAGVSAQTVSNVVNGNSARVSAETAQRVIEAIDGLGYRVNQSARSLRRGRTGLIGLAVPLLASEYYGELADRLSQRFSELGIHLVTESTGGALDAELQSLAASHLETYDGFILALAASESLDLDRISPGKPVVLLGERALSTTWDHVMMDNVEGARIATSYLLERGSSSIAALGGAIDEGDSVQSLRTRGYLQAHREAGAPVPQELILGTGLDMTDGYRYVRALLDAGRPFDGVFALTDSCAFGALRALHEAGRQVPRDVQVVGFDNVRAAGFSVPTLTTIEPSNDEMADAIVEAMMARLAPPGAPDGPDRPPPPRRVITPSRLIVRESTR